MLAADYAGAFTDTCQSEATPLGICTCRGHGVKADAVIMNLEPDALVLVPDEQVDFTGLRMLENVIEVSCTMR